MNLPGARFAALCAHFWLDPRNCGLLTFSGLPLGKIEPEGKPSKLGVNCG